MLPPVAFEARTAISRKSLPCLGNIKAGGLPNRRTMEYYLDVSDSIRNLQSGEQL